ncbi:AMP-binding protein [Streptomyces sp. NBC_00500]|uniref:AMP-binding protein n=1 Tax=unclassified Streptomyces TaxID=2593676 RepID=UPI00386D2D4C
MGAPRVRSTGVGNGGVHRLVAERVREAPAALAVREAPTGRELNYRRLWESSGRMAARLAEHGIGPGSVVALDLDRGADLVVALLGVVRTGASYLPLDGHATHLPRPGPPAPPLRPAGRPARPRRPRRHRVRPAERPGRHPHRPVGPARAAAHRHRQAGPLPRAHTAARPFRRPPRPRLLGGAQTACSGRRRERTGNVIGCQ